MQAVVLVLLLGLSLCGVHGSEEQSTPDVLSMVKELQTKVQTLENQNQDLKSEVQSLKTGLPQNQQVGFFACLYNITESGTYGPFDVRTTIKYQQVMTNVANGYDAATGVFTAPLRGLYVFHFTVQTSVSPPPYVMASLRRNNVILAYVDDRSKLDPYDSSTRVAVVTLEVGDRVYVALDPQYYFYDYLGRYSSFSGFLLSPM